MIVDPDFFDHWRTRMVVDALQDEMAPVYIMRLWAHCQTRKSDRHTMPAAGLKAQCRAPHDAAKFEQALTEAGFVERDGQDICVVGWADQNASLIAAWENGGKGGRPKKPTGNPRETHGKPDGNPAVTHGEPNANPGETDKSREEKRREEDSPSLRSGEGAKPRASRKCPDSFSVTEDLKAWAVEHCQNVDLMRETAKFRDHTFKVAHSDWVGAWRNWMRKASEYAQPSRASPSKPPTSAQMAMAQACPTLVAPHLQGYAKQHEPTYAEVINADARLLD